MLDAGFIASGLLVGLLVGITGVGGGALLTPILLLIFGVSAPQAVGTDLVFAAITKSVGVLVHHRHHRSVEWPIVRKLSCGSIPGALLVLWLLQGFSREGRDVNPLLVTSLGVALVLTSIALVIRGSRIIAVPQVTQRQQSETAQTLLTITAGLLLGVLVTVSSVGAGALGATVLAFLYPHLRTVAIVGTDVAYAIPLTLVAGCGHWLLGNVDPAILTGLLIGSLPGIWIGSYWSGRIPERILRTALSLILFITGVSLIRH